MKIVSFTMVNNESEIIESFIRYNYNFLDEMYIIDNGCTDNTIKILHNLKNDGYKIVIYDESLEAYDQFRLDNKYLNKIIEESNPDLIIPLDADEFIISDHKDPRKEMEKLSLDKIYYVNWQWYVMTEKDDPKETFIPRRLKYCLKRTVWNYSDGTPVTKVILPARYFKEKKLTMSMGHHTVYGDKSIAIEEINNIKLAHYRAISEEQLVYKTCCYTMRDIATMGNNIETAQRTNQLAKIESGISMHDAAIEASYAGYPKENAVIARFARVFGADKKHDTKAMSQFMDKAVLGEDIILKSKGQQRYSYCYIADAVSGLFKLLLDGQDGEAYNISDDDEGLTLGEYAEYIASLANLKVRYEIENNESVSKATYALLDTRKIKNIGWEPQYSVKDGLKRTYTIKKETLGSM